MTVASPGLSDEVLFQAAQDAVKSLSQLDDRNKLRLYAHYKQATMGPAQGSRPSMFQQVARAKWDAWAELASMSKTDAMQGYCLLADEFVPGWESFVKEERSGRNGMALASVAVASPGLSDEVLFQAAQDAVKSLSQLDDRNKLRLYAHYKQATVGPAQGSRPSMFQQIARAKWDAWAELASMSKTDSMRGYCLLADEFVPGWRENFVKEERSGRNGMALASVAVASPGLSDEVLFQAAQDAVKSLSQLDDRNKLRLYAHYKQATMGPAQGSRPSMFQQIARAKWDAWAELASMSKTDSMRGYCLLADEFVPGWRESFVKEERSGRNGMAPASVAVASPGLSDEVLFKAAQDAVKSLSQLDNRSKLRLYAHYKQASVGPAQGSRPSMLQQVARAKWDAWAELASMSKTDAMQGYCLLADEFVPGWRKSFVKEERSGRNGMAPASVAGAPPCLSDEVLFKAAQEAVKSLSQLDDRNKLRLYAHYKQATVGPAQGSRPSIFQQVARAKWDAWAELASMSKTDAMQGYCLLADEFVRGWRESFVKEERSGRNGMAPASVAGAPPGLSDEVLFQAAQDAVKSLSQLDDRNKLRLYAHYKQATVGPAQGSRPSIFQQVARAKWDAWAELASMSKTDAMQGYCLLAVKFVPGWRESFVKEEWSGRNAMAPASVAGAPPCLSDEVLFKAAQEAVKSLSQLDDRNKLRLYAHYKQATMGPAQGSRPSIFQQVARAKWDAWAELASMSKTDAMQGYCLLADEFVPSWRQRFGKQEPSLRSGGSAVDILWEQPAGVASETVAGPEAFPLAAPLRRAWAQLDRVFNAGSERPERIIQEMRRDTQTAGSDVHPVWPEPDTESTSSFFSVGNGANGAGNRFRLREMLQRELAVEALETETVEDSEGLARARSLLAALGESLPTDIVHCPEGFYDRSPLHKVPDAVVQPQCEEQVLALLQKAARSNPKRSSFVVIPGGASASAFQLEEDTRPVVSLDMRRLNRILWVNKEDRMACVEAGISASRLREELAREGMALGMETESELTTLGGWLATRARSMKEARYGNIEDMLVEVRVATSSGLVWQKGGRGSREDLAFGRRSTGLNLPGLILGSQGCLGVITAAVVRIHPLPEQVEYESVAFDDWAVSFVRAISQLPQALRPSFCRLMDGKQLDLMEAWAEECHFPQHPAAALVLEGSCEETAAQRRELKQLVASCHGRFTGAALGESCYQMILAMPQLADACVDFSILSETLEAVVPWSHVCSLWPALIQAVVAEHQALHLPGRPFLSCCLGHSEGALLRICLKTSVEGLAPAAALSAFRRLRAAASKAVGGRQGTPGLTALKSLKAALDPQNVLRGSHVG
ncbi:unnamed protein product [Effrenium voratum]|uniref:Alkylglycerone-phosphate synthase n=1 Tax=Effrenium voratum TaxID=2562239 RepID=A0AA36IDU0_9DINO|nr:unnamed protein product [Effrenium voratum]